RRTDSRKSVTRNRRRARRSAWPGLSAKRQRCRADLQHDFGRRPEKAAEDQGTRRSRTKLCPGSTRSCRTAGRLHARGLGLHRESVKRTEVFSDRLRSWRVGNTKRSRSQRKGEARSRLRNSTALCARLHSKLAGISEGIFGGPIQRRCRCGAKV